MLCYCMKLFISLHNFIFETYRRLSSGFRTDAASASYMHVLPVIWSFTVICSCLFSVPYLVCYGHLATTTMPNTYFYDKG